jgi:hypothetical protein
VSTDPYSLGGCTFKGSPLRFAFSIVEFRALRFGEHGRFESCAIEGGAVANIDWTANAFALRRRSGESKQPEVSQMPIVFFVGFGLQVEPFVHSVEKMFSETSPAF